LFRFVEKSTTTTEKTAKGDKTTKKLIGQFENWTNKKVLDVSGGKDEEGRPVLVWGNHGKTNQQW
jgi:hypothetical protein